MNATRHLPFLLLLIFSVSLHTAFAQQTQPTSNGFKIFFEKVYLHVDRCYYASGDNIWFKAYLVNAQGNYFTNTSNNLYVELIRPDNSMAAREVIRMNNGIGVGDF